MDTVYLGKRVGRIVKRLVIVAAALFVIAAIAGVLVVRALVLPPSDQFGAVEDEARQAGRTAETLSGAQDDYFVSVDKGLLAKPGDGEDYPVEVLQVADDTGLEPEEVRLAAIRGQNMWLVWTGGNDRFWNWAAANTLGAFDLLKLMSSHPSQAYGRFNRFRWLGLINEPCHEQATEADPERFGLWLDTRSADCDPDPFADPESYPGVEIGARGKNVPVGSYYGESTGIMGLRLFTNPDFDEAAQARWDPVRFYEDESYYNDADLVRPYRVGMSCGFCHVGPNPIKPPKDVEEPDFANMTSNPGAQYYWVDRIFFWDTEPRPDATTPAKNERNFLYQLFHSNPMGTLDTSLVSTDYMNNPRSMNAVYETRARLLQAMGTGKEQVKDGEMDNVQFQDYPQTEALSSLYDPVTGDVASMRVLKDGADSVGTLGALNRVYLNIGTFSEEWLLHFRPFLGGQKISPIRIADAKKSSSYWRATEDQSPDTAIYFLVTGRADKLADAPGGARLLAQTDATVDRGKELFAENCAACHTSTARQPTPEPAFGVDMDFCEGGGSGARYRECWDRYWAWTQSDSFRSQMSELVKADDFLDGNYLSNERRVPMDVLGVNACSPIASNGLRGDIWDNFTSDSYKTLPPAGPVTVEHPVSGAPSSFQAAGNGRGYLRPASLVSLWTSAPYLLNNAVGMEKHHYPSTYYEAVDDVPETAAAEPSSVDGSTAGLPASVGDYGHGTRTSSCPSIDADNPYMPCVENRVANFEKSMRLMLSPEARRKDEHTVSEVPGYLYRTSAPSCLIIPEGFSPEIVQRFSGVLSRIAPWAVKPGGAVEIGPFPADFPINALLNTELLPDNDSDTSLLAHAWKIAKAAPALLGTFRDLGGTCSVEQLADPAIQQHASEVLKKHRTVDTLVGLSKCPDYVVNKGHEFGSRLSDADKEALISYLKHF
ncbi:c-type cytochrome [Granulosicoccus sp. 3-233]|uniref:c-type cytochrome n=1 Tax=Granulosicoccus sp. 3-233 TaxID=3417969 RepID=UPI003D3328FD